MSSKRELAKSINRSAAELAQVSAFAQGEDARCLNEPPALAVERANFSRAVTMVSQARAKKGSS